MEQEIKALISSYDSIIIVSHVHPDGDAIGSVFGLAEVIRENFSGIKVMCAGEEKASLSDIAAMDRVADADFLNSLTIVIDTANTDRVSDSRWATSPRTIKIDHHPAQDSFGDVEWVDTGFSSSCEMVVDLMTRWGGRTSKQGAELLLFGMITDTGRFRYPSVTPRTLDYASALIRAGAELQPLYKRLYTESLDEVRFKGRVLSSFSVAEERVAYMKFTRKAIAESGVSPSVVLRNVNLLANITGIPIWAFFVETGGQIRVELRSSGPAVNTTARRFGGGGHKLAAGIKVDTWDEVDRIIEELCQVALEAIGLPS